MVVTRQGRILLVEDNPYDRELVMRALQKCCPEIEVEVAENGEVALSCVRGSRELPDLVLLDLKLPKVGGIEVLEHIRSDQGTRLVPVVVLTSSSLERDVTGSYAAGCNGYVCKPSEYRELTRLMEAVFRFWLDANVRPCVPSA